MTDDLKKLTTIIEQTDALITLAESAEWDDLVDLEKKRADLISDFFKQTPQLEKEHLAQSIQYILEKNQILKQLSLSQRDSLRMEMSKANHAGKAVNSYLDAAG